MGRISHLCLMLYYSSDFQVVIYLLCSSLMNFAFSVVIYTICECTIFFVLQYSFCISIKVTVSSNFKVEKCV